MDVLSVFFTDSINEQDNTRKVSQGYISPKTNGRTPISSRRIFPGAWCAEKWLALRNADRQSSYVGWEDLTTPQGPMLLKLSATGWNNGPQGATVLQAVNLGPKGSVQFGSIPVNNLATDSRDPIASSYAAMAHAWFGGHTPHPVSVVWNAPAGIVGTNNVEVAKLSVFGLSYTTGMTIGAAPATDLVAAVGTYTPPPALLNWTSAPAALVFHWPTAPAQAIHPLFDTQYHEAYFALEPSSNCVTPVSPNAFYPGTPTYYPSTAAGNGTWPATGPWFYPSPDVLNQPTGAGTFTVQPSTAGVCTFPVTTVYASRSNPPVASLPGQPQPQTQTMQVMGWLTLNGTATSQTAPLSAGSLAATGQSLTVNASKTFDNDPAGITFAGLSWNPASCGSALTFTASGNNTAGSGPTGTATHSFVITDSTPPSSALTCTGTVSDQYGEPAVSFTTNVAAGITAFVTWPAGGIVEATSGATLAMLPMHEPLIAQLLGAEMADALTTGCKAVAIQNGMSTFPTSYTPASFAQLPPAAQTLLAGQGYSLSSDGSGCVMQNGAPAAQAPIVAYVPGSTSTTTPTYKTNAPCTAVSLGLPNPLSGSGAQVGWAVIPGSNPGSCTVNITSASASPAPGSGSIPVQVAQYPCQFIGGSCTLPAGGIGPNTTSCQPITSGGGSGSVTSYTYHWFGTPLPYPPIGGPVPATVGVVSGLTFTRTGPGTVYGVMETITRNMVGWPCHLINGGDTWSLFVTIP